MNTKRNKRMKSKCLKQMELKKDTIEFVKNYELLVKNIKTLKGEKKNDTK